MGSDDLYDAAVDAIRKVVSEPGASAEDVRYALEGLIDEIKMLKDSLPDEA